MEEGGEFEPMHLLANPAQFTPVASRAIRGASRVEPTLPLLEGYQRDPTCRRNEQTLDGDAGGGL
jgi:hypothetical protein